MNSETKRQIVHTNDLHNRFPLKTLASIVKKGALLLDSGDAIAGSNTVFRWQEPILNQMREAGYQAMAMGNREFHYIRKILLRRMEAANFPILSSNVVDLRNQVKVQPSLMLELGGIKIGIFGLTVPQYPVLSFWEKATGWRFLDPLSTASLVVSKLRQAGSSLVFCLSHLGFPLDQRLAESCREINVIFGGHSHTLLPNVFWQGGTAIVQGGSHGKFIGNYQLDLSLEGNILKSWTLEGELLKAHD